MRQTTRNAHVAFASAFTEALTEALEVPGLLRGSGAFLEVLDVLGSPLLLEIVHFDCSVNQAAVNGMQVSEKRRDSCTALQMMFIGKQEKATKLGSPLHRSSPDTRTVLKRCSDDDEANRGIPYRARCGYAADFGLEQQWATALPPDTRERGLHRSRVSDA